MRWPWQRRSVGEQLVISWTGQTFAFVRARTSGNGLYEVLGFGVEHQGADTAEDFIRRLQALRLNAQSVHVMLRPQQYQLLQIDAPAVPPEEMRSAARYQIKELLLTHVDDVTLDVMRVGDASQQKGAGHLFVVAATNEVIRSMLSLGEALHLAISVIDIQETAQRNLQNAMAQREASTDRANAALILVDGQQAVLTISAHEELFYTRRFELPEGFLTAPLGADRSASAEASRAYAPVEEYVPDYSVGGVSYGNDYTGSTASAPASATGSPEDNERAQRFLLEVQRSLDVWDRSWSSMPLHGVCVYAGERSEELSTWLGMQLGQVVKPLNVRAMFAGFDGGTPVERDLCVPLLGVLMRTESRKL